MVSLNLGKHNFWIRRKTNAIISLLAQGSKNSVFLLPAPHTKEKLLDVRSSMNPWDKALCMCVLTSQWTSGCLYVGNTLRQLTLAIISLPTRMVCGHSELEASKGLKRLGKRGNWVLRALSLGGIGEVTQLVHQSVPASAALKLPDPHLAPLPAQLLSQSPDSVSLLPDLPFTLYPLQSDSLFHNSWINACMSRSPTSFMWSKQRSLLSIPFTNPSATSDTPLHLLASSSFLGSMTPGLWVFSTLISPVSLLTPHLPPNLFSYVFFLPADFNGLRIVRIHRVNVSVSPLSSWLVNPTAFSILNVYLAHQT